ncbi:hypothetical protein TNCV_3459451 [Trichonephila clavipes]|nr:hypothetical protein TNCV_3459451 [Trichonephila clavipes]
MPAQVSPLSLDCSLELRDPLPIAFLLLYRMMKRIKGVKKHSFLDSMTLSLDFNESDSEQEYFPEIDEYSNDSDTELSICDEEDEEMDKKRRYT